MRENVELHGGVVFSQRVLTALIVDAGWSRERAYRAVQALAQRARDGEGGFRDLVAADIAISDALNPVALARCFEVEAYLEHIDVTYRRLGLATRGGPAPRVPPEPAGALAVEAGIGGGRMS